MRKIFLITVFPLLTTSAVFASSLTMSTYYPAPFGAYDRLRLVPRQPTGIPACDSSTEGLMYYNFPEHQVKVCGPSGFNGFGGVWTESNHMIYPTNTLADSALKVGIGTVAPQGVLHIYKASDALGRYGNINFFNGGDEVTFDGGNDGIFNFKNTNNVAGSRTDLDVTSTNNTSQHILSLQNVVVHGQDTPKMGVGTIAPAGTATFVRTAASSEDSTWYGNLTIFPDYTGSSFAEMIGEVAYNGGTDGIFGFTNTGNNPGMDYTGKTNFNIYNSSTPLMTLQHWSYQHGPEASWWRTGPYGRVGIMQSAPQATLDVNGNIHLSRAAPASVADPKHIWWGNLTFFGDTDGEMTFDGGADGVFGIVNTNSDSGARVDFKDENGNHLMTIKNNGTVGILTATPTAPLHIVEDTTEAHTRPHSRLGEHVWFKAQGLSKSGDDGGVNGYDQGIIWMEYGSVYDDVDPWDGSDKAQAPIMVMADYDNSSRIYFEEIADSIGDAVHTELNPAYLSWIGLARGDLRASSQTGAGQFNHPSADMAIMLGFDRSTGIASGANLGINTLSPTQTVDINGTMRLTPRASAPNCNPAAAGTLYVDTTGNTLCYCNGGGWTGVGGISTNCN